MFNPNKCKHTWRKIPKDLLLYRCTKCGWIVFKNEREFETFSWGHWPGSVKRNRKTGDWYSCGGWFHEPWAMRGFDHYIEDSVINKGSPAFERCEQLYRWCWERRTEQLKEFLDYFKKHGHNDWSETLWLRMECANLQSLALEKTGMKHPVMRLLSLDLGRPRR